MQDHERLSEYMAARRLALGMKTWRDLSARAEISYETLRALRAGGRPSEATTHQLERALQWEPGSVRTIITGGEPTPLPDLTGPQGQQVEVKQAQGTSSALPGLRVEMHSEVDFGIGDAPPFLEPRDDTELEANETWQAAKNLERVMRRQRERSWRKLRETG